jgi:ferredoxin-nitrite reductase
VLGGYFSIKRIAGAIPMDCWIPAEDAMDFCRAVLTLFRDFGGRKDRQKARLMWLIEEMGMEKFRHEVLALMTSFRGGEGEEGVSVITHFEPAQQYTTEWTLGHRSLLGIHPQKQEDLHFIGVHIPVGRLSVSECRILADLADKYSHGEIRLTVEQNVIFPNIHTNQVTSFTEEPVFHQMGSRLSIYPGQISGQVVSCTGSQFCPLALVETKLTIDTLTRKLDELITMPKPVRIHMTGSRYIVLLLLLL